MAFDKKKFLSRFAEEARKHLKQMREGIMLLEKDPQQKDMINTIFRSAHTIKGSASMLSLEPISVFAHSIEQVFSNMRDGNQQLDKQLADVLLQAADHLQLMIKNAEEQKDIAAVPSALLSALEGQQALPSSSKKDTIQKQDTLRNTNFSLSEQKLDELMKQISELSVWTFDQKSNIDAMNHIAEELHHISHQLEKQGVSIPPRLQGICSFTENLAYKMQKGVYDLNRLSTELQDNLIDLRMVPISLITDQIPRFVRDTALAMEKEVQLSITGIDTELDRTILDKVEQALLHIIRNALDHGIESKEARIASNKPAIGTISLEAGYSNGMCQITISDDGKGIESQKLIEKAKKLSLISEQQASEYGRNLSSSQLVSLLCLPGLSSAPLITETSGRGVGMDVVHQCIVDELSGEIHIDTKAHEGTRITLLLPLNQAVMDVFIFGLGKNKIALPASAIKKVLQGDEFSFIEVAQRKAIRLEQQLLPILSLRQLFFLDDAAKQERAYIVVVESGQGEVALLVDEIVEQSHALIQSLPSYLQDNQYISGCIISTANQVINVINPHCLSSLSTVKSESGAPLQEKKSIAKPISILVVDDSLSTRDIEKSILESYGFRVELASDGLQAFETAKEEQFDLIITDIEMPRMDGIELTKKLREEKAYRHIPIILVTSRDKVEDRRKGIEAGCDAYIVKSSFDQEHLIQTIRTLTGAIHAK